MTTKKEPQHDDAWLNEIIDAEGVAEMLTVSLEKSRGLLRTKAIECVDLGGNAGFRTTRRAVVAAMQGQTLPKVST